MTILSKMTNHHLGVRGVGCRRKKIVTQDNIGKTETISKQGKRKKHKKLKLKYIEQHHTKSNVKKEEKEKNSIFSSCYQTIDIDNNFNRFNVN